MSRAKKKASEEKPAWEKVFDHVKKRITQKEMGKLSIGEGLRLAKILKMLEADASGGEATAKRPRGAMEEEQSEGRAQAALRVLEERSPIGGEAAENED